MDKIAIVILTYNLENYISESIESVLNQKTTYQYRIFIGDDASSDRTPDILKDYAQKYPDKIEVRYSNTNLGCLGNGNRMFDKLQSEYFTLLDGDDIWLDEYHLQKQIDFLETHKDYIICAANTQYIRNGKPSEYMIDSRYLNETYSFEDFLNNDVPYFHPSATMFRNVIYKYGLPACYKEAENTFENCALRGDDFRRIQHLEKGKLFLMDNLFSYYRIHENGIWQGATELKRNIETAIENNFLRKYYKNTSYFTYFNNCFAGSYTSLLKKLIFKFDFLNIYKLNIKETELLTSLFCDIAKENIPFGTESKTVVYEKRMDKNNILIRCIRKIVKLLKNIV